jgi:phage terminase small subunit
MPKRTPDKVIKPRKKSVKKHVIPKSLFEEINEELNPKQAMFCMKYIELKMNGTAAALAAGYSTKNAKVSAVQLLSSTNVQKYINELKKDIGRQIGITAADIAREYAKIGFADIRNIFDEDGNLINIKNFGDKEAGNVSSIEIFEEYQGAGKDREYIGMTKKIKLNDKVRGLDSLAKMMNVDGVTKVASTDAKGNETNPPMSDAQVDKIIDVIKSKKKAS